jgi:hypothetical protein
MNIFDLENDIVQEPSVKANIEPSVKANIEPITSDSNSSNAANLNIFDLENEIVTNEVSSPSPEDIDTLNKKNAAMQAARALPKETNEERAIRDQAIRDASRIGKNIVYLSGGNTIIEAAKGAAASILGANQLTIDTMKAIGIENILDLNVEELSDENLEKIQRINDSIQNKDFFSASTMGRIIPTLVTLPVAYQTKMAAFMLEGALGYSEARGRGESGASSAISGLIAGGASAGVIKLFEMYGKRGEKVLNEVIAEFDNTSKPVSNKLDSIYKNYAKYTGKDIKDLNNYDKTMAILAQGDDIGAAYMKTAATNDYKAKKVLDTLSKTRAEAVTNATNKGNIAKIIKPLEEQQAFASTKYTEFKNLIFGKGPQDITFIKEPVIEELSNIPDLSKTPIINKVLKKLQNETTVNLEDLFDIREAMNGVTVKIKRVDKKTAQAIDGREYIDSIIKVNMPDEFASTWDKLRSELSLAYSTKGANAIASRNNKFGELLSQVNKGERTYTSILNDIAKASGGPKKFKELMQAIGTDKQVEFEKGLVSEIFNSKNNNLGKTIEQMKHLGFITPEGKNLNRELRLLDEAFSSDDFYKIAADMIESGKVSDSTAITANLLSKFKYSTMGAVWDFLKKYAPTDKGKFLRHMNRVTKAIVRAKPEIVGIKEITPEMYNGFQKVIRESIEQTINKEILELEKTLNISNIEAMQSGKPISLPNIEGNTVRNVDITSSQLNVSPEGQVITDMFEYDSNKIIRNFVDESLVTNELKFRMGLPSNSSINEVTDKIAGRIDTYINETRLQNITKSYSKEIQGAIATQDRAKGYQVAKNIAEMEANNLIRNIEKDFGMKLPKSEADKIVIGKIKEIINGCK